MAVTKLDTSWNVGASWNNGTANYTFRLVVIQESQNVGANQSVITVNKYVKGNSGNSWHTTACPDVFSGDISNTITYRPAMQGTPPNDYGPMRNTEVLYHQVEQYTINHNADGTKQINITTTFTNGGNSYAPKTNTKTFTVTLDTIPRASTISLNASSLNINGTSGNIGWTATSKADYYHTLTWSLGSVTNQQIATVNHLNNTSVSGTLNYQTLLNALSTSATGTLTLTLKTYSDSAKTTQIGDTQTATCNITIGIKPTVELLNIFADTTPITNYAIAGYSNIASDFSATTPYGATGITTYFSIDSGTMATQTSTSASGTARSNTLPSNAGTGTYQVTISAYTVDSRGNRSATVSRTLTCYQYTPPVANLTAIRTTQTGTTQDSGGSYLYVVFSGSAAASINGQNSVASGDIVCTSTGGVSGSLTSGNHYSLSTDATAKVTLIVTDRVGGQNKVPIQVPTAVFPIDMYDNGAGTVGVGIGGIAPESAKCKFYIPTEGIDYNDLDNLPAGEMYGTCSTGASTKAKVVTITGFPSTLETGQSVTVKFTNNNTATAPTLNVNSTGAHGIVRYGTTTAGTNNVTSWRAGAVIRLTYDGTNWVMNNFNQDDTISQANIQNSSSTSYGMITGQRYKQAYDFYSEWDELYNGTLTGTNSTTFDYSAYKAYLILGKPAKYDGSSLDTGICSMVIPKALITASNVQYQLGSGTIFSSFYLKYSGTTVTLTKHQGGPIYQVYGIK